MEQRNSHKIERKPEHFCKKLKYIPVMKCGRIGQLNLFFYVVVGKIYSRLVGLWFTLNVTFAYSIVPCKMIPYA